MNDDLGIVYCNTISCVTMFIIDGWIKSADGCDRFYFGNNNRSYYRSGDNWHTFRGTDNSGRTGNIECSDIISNTINCTNVNTGNISTNVLTCTGGINLPNNWNINVDSAENLNIIHKTKNSRWYFSGVTQSYINNNWIQSDKRIKKNIKEINNSINFINKLKLKQFTLLDDKDEIFKFGLISQEVKEVIPDLVFIDNNYIGNIYSIGIYNNKIITMSKDISNILKIGDKIKIILDNDKNKEFIMNQDSYYNRNKKRFSIIKSIINNYSFEIEDDIEINQENNKIFVYGTFVKDFHKLDYNSIFSLNVAATQELYKEHIQLKEEHVQLKEDYLQLKKEHMELKEKFNILLNKLELSF